MRGRLLRRMAAAGIMLGLAGLFVVVSVGTVHAQFGPECPTGQPYLGRDACYGYFTGQYRQAPSGKDSVVFKNGLHANNSDQFIQILRDYLASNDLQNRVGAAMIVNAMLGKKGPEFGGSRQNGIDYANANLGRLSTLVKQYEARGDVIWSMTTTSNNPRGERIHHVVYDPVMQDAFNKSTPFYTAQIIRFKVPKGETGEPFQIERDCGNIFGYAGPLKGTPPSGDLNPPTPANGDQPPGYAAGDSALYSSCQRISGHAIDPNKMGYAVRVNISYKIGTTSVNGGTAVAATSGTRLFTLDTPGVVRSSMDPVTVTAVGVDADNKQFSITGSPMTLGPCQLVQPACDGASVIPQSVDPGTPYAIKASVRYGSDAQAAKVLAQSGSRFFVTVSGPGVNTTLSDVRPVGRDGSVLTVTTPQQPPTGQAGVYVIGYGIAGPSGAISCGAPADVSPPKFVVANKPYVSVKNGDVAAGAALSAGGQDCTAVDQKAGIVSWNRGSAGGYTGAGTNLGALAMNHLQDFATGQGSPLSPSGASLANNGDGQVNTGAGLFGGKFGAGSCTADYFKNASNVQSGNVTIAGRTIANGSREVIYVTGNVYITGNITFSGSYADPAGIPAFSIVVKGNIYIAPNVTQLDGFYLAQPTSSTASNGVVYTCASGPFAAAPLDRNLGGTCNTALTVNGAVSARQIWLLRTAGSVSAGPAETFNYSPEMWLSLPFGNGLSRDDDGYDAITSLPPVL